MKKDFNIENIDPLGQGVDKQNGEITFIKKTLPGETGSAEVTSSKKGVNFAKLHEIKTKSPDRITPACPHFDHCNACDFLHTYYTKEIEFKKNNILRSLSFLGVEEITFHEAPKRDQYRNRIQLHYNLKLQQLGFLNDQLKIVKVDQCIIGTPKITAKIKELYQNNSWILLTRHQPIEGHLELYEKDGEVKVNFNRPYADGGFTQVNQEMNERLVQFLNQTFTKILNPTDAVFDLFGGNGNISKLLKNNTLVVDQYHKLPTNNEWQSFLNQDLYVKNAISKIKAATKLNPALIIFDPPRSGVKNLNEYLNAFSPKKLVYISCQFTSFTRDIKPILENYQLTEVHIFDLFPGTHHFETVGIFTKCKIS